MNSENKESLLIERIRKGDEDAFKLVFLAHYTPLCKYIWKYVRSDDLAEEIVQEVFADIWEKREKLDKNGHMRGLLYESARNKALNYIKHQKIVDRYISEAKYQNKEDAYVIPDVKDNDDHTFAQEARKAIEKLPPKARQIYKLNQEEGLTYNEIAGYLGISPKTVESQMRRALQILRESLSEFLMVFILVIVVLFLR